MKSILKYPGAKNRLTPWICEYIPKHDVYVEPFAGTLYEVDSNKNTFSIKQNNGEIIEINCADVEEIFSEEEIGTIN